MKRTAFIFLSAAALALVEAPAWAQGKTAWLHVRVEEARRESKVHVNLPLTVVEAALAMAPEKIMSNGHIHLDAHGHELSMADLRKLWKGLRESGEAEIVSVEDKDETVNVRREGDRIRILVEKASAKGSRKETVHVELPVAVVDAALAGEGSEPDLRGALKEIQKLRGDVVRVDDGDSQVRVWIDERD